MSKKKIRMTNRRPSDGIERWRCPQCKQLTTVLIFDRPTKAQPMPPDPSFACQACKTVWDYKTGARHLGSKAAAAACRVLQIQGKLR